MTKQQVYKAEHEKLTELFKDADESVKKLVEGLIQEAASFYADNYELRKLLNEIGLIKVHPQHKELKKLTTEAKEVGKEIRQNSSNYSVIIKTLYGILGKVEIDDEDDMSEYE